MKQRRVSFLKILALLTIAMVPNGTQADLTIGPGGSPQSGTLDFDLNLQTSVQLVIQDGTNIATGNQTTIVGGQVDFGNIDTITCTPAANKGDCFRLAANNGSTLVGRFDLVPTASGFPNGVTVEVHRTDAIAAPGNPPTGRLYWTTANSGDNGGTGFWDDPDANTTTLSESAAAKDSVFSGASGTTIGFQVGVKIADSDAPGAKNAQVTFTVTGNP